MAYVRYVGELVLLLLLFVFHVLKSLNFSSNIRIKFYVELTLVNLHLNV